MVVVVVVVETDVRRARRSWGDGVCMMAILTIDLCLLVEEDVLRRPGCEAKQNENLQLMSETEPFGASGLATLANQMRWNTQHGCHTNPNYCRKQSTLQSTTYILYPRAKMKFKGVVLLLSYFPYQHRQLFNLNDSILYQRIQL